MADYKSVQLSAQDLSFYIIGKKGEKANALDKPEAIRWTSWWGKKKDAEFTFFPGDTHPNGYPVNIFVSSKILNDEKMSFALLDGDLGFYGWSHDKLKDVKDVKDGKSLRFLSDYQDLSKFLGQKAGAFSVYFWMPTEKSKDMPILLVFMPKGEWINASRFSEGTEGPQFPKESLKELSATTIDEPLNDYMVHRLGLKIPERGINRLNKFSATK
ncbi:hypothetical protein CC86DRAFT_98299 [Ophiobolus disseminans]|uniref:Uncharacterized protein n=1 Tax=Ophiobolus disseminans TaxID=1469910 RepID=A0A6A6ZKH4_9PLEO|nr:hypothetical protein CC86DRAFT_98299 [Ophiobolus disseminans]